MAAAAPAPLLTVRPHCRPTCERRLEGCQVAAKRYGDRRARAAAVQGSLHGGAGGSEAGARDGDLRAQYRRQGMQAH